MNPERHPETERSSSPIKGRPQAYQAFPSPIINGERGGFDIHIYYANESDTIFAKQLHERIRREWPELRIYKFWDKPVGPHAVSR